jgi:glucose/arabinose dehydrogenase
VLPYEPVASARTRPSAFFGRSLLTLALLIAACSSDKDPPQPSPDGGVQPGADSAVPPTPDASLDTGPAPNYDAPPLMEDVLPSVDDAGVAAKTFCSQGVDVPGTTVPGGFCLRRFAGVLTPRTLSFAPNGDLFVGSPKTGTPGSAPPGLGAVLVLHDDDKDGVAEMSKFLEGVDDVHGVALGDGFLYFTTQANVWRTPYTVGQRRETGPREHMGLPAAFGTGGRWTHGLARSPAGVLYASRGQYQMCGGNSGGEISRVSMGTSLKVATGFRNPMYLRCHYKDEVCAAMELGEDAPPSTGTREKLINIRADTHYGYPYCHAPNISHQMCANEPMRSCAQVTSEERSFVINETPFGFDWEQDKWPEPYRGALFVALHGSFYTSPAWQGARIVVARTDPQTRMPIESWQHFVGGFGPQGSLLDRPADVAFAPDGRMFFADDQGGGVYWVAPTSLTRPN